jgi:hypothetical protein
MWLPDADRHDDEFVTIGQETWDKHYLGNAIGCHHLPWKYF